MNAWKRALVTSGKNIREAALVLDSSSMQIALVVDEAGRLLGTITDGDIRRGILKGLSLEESVQKIMNPAPTVARAEDSRDAMLALMQRKQLHHIPVIDQDRVVVGLETVDDLMQSRQRPNRVVLMAGGLGSRLRPLTDDTPKPMLKVGTKPLLETILENFIEHGFRHFSISVNYMAEIVRDYFGDGSRWGVHITYLEETSQLGTAGALSLLTERPQEPLLVMNGDVLTKVNFTQLLDFHAKHRAQGTMCVREYGFQVPYGVVNISGHRLEGITEKPVQRYFVNAGIYVLEPEALDFIPADTRFDMPSLFERLVELRQETVVFPVREYWLDIGQIADYERANGEFANLFT